MSCVHVVDVESITRTPVHQWIISLEYCVRIEVLCSHQKKLL